MRRNFLITCIAGALAAVAGGKQAVGGLLHRRGILRFRRPNCPSDGQYRSDAPEKTVASLATLLVILKSAINERINDQTQRAEIDNTLMLIMGDPDSILTQLGEKVLVRKEMVSREEVRTLFDGEVFGISQELRRLTGG